ncbi:MAG: DNA alkylation response protein, partial [Gaiellaceae bacterium]
PRIYRQQPLQSIWEGSGNVVCLDVLRALRREPESLEALLGEIALAGEADLSKTAERAAAEADEPGARHAVERLALALQASLLVRHAPPGVADAFRARSGSAYGTLPRGVDAAAIVERHRPAI